ncbi:MAG: hypothetical protein M3112_06345 [Actinomycetia bacterium]|nr:hypothetical protein [Actinomycetes bacterium]
MSKLVVLLVGLILLLAGCTSDSAPDPASGPLVVIGTSPTPTRTTTTTTTTPRASIDPTECSAVDLDGEVEDYPGAYDGLTNPAEATRKAIIEAALSCDFDALMVIPVVFPEYGPAGEDRTYIFGGVTTDFDEFVAYDQDHGVLRKLALTLSSVPVDRFETEFNTGLHLIGFVWPPEPDLYDNQTSTKLTLEETWDADTIERVAALNDLTSAELIASVAEPFNSFSSFGVLILDDGRWFYANDIG